MTNPDAAVIDELQKEVKRLNVKLDALINYLQLGKTLGPPSGRSEFDSMVKSILAKANL